MKLTPIKANMTELDLGNGVTVLFSYKTPVAYVSNGGEFVTRQYYSRTTTKHINSWLQSRGCFEAIKVDQSEIDSLVK